MSRQRSDVDDEGELELNDVDNWFGLLRRQKLYGALGFLSSLFRIQGAPMCVQYSIDGRICCRRTTKSRWAICVLYPPGCVDMRNGCPYLMW